MNEITRIDLAFENCEDVAIPAKDVRFLYAGDINESIRFDNILAKSSERLSTYRTAGLVRLIIRNRPEYNRILEYDDIAQIHLYDSDDNHEWFFTDYDEVWGHENANQQTELINDETEIHVIIGGDPK